MSRPSLHRHALRASLVLIPMLLVVGPLPAVASGVVDVVSHQLPGRVDAGTTVTVAVTLRNGGSETWDPAAGFKVSYHWLEQDGDVVVWDGARTDLPAPVAPGEVVSLEGLVEVPLIGGRIDFQWDVVQEGVRWLSDQDPAASTPVPVEIDRPYAFTVVRGRGPTWLETGETTRRKVVLRNDGSLPWPADGSFALSYHWRRRTGDGVIWDGLRTPLPRVVPPGGEVEVLARVRAPERGGRYSLEWDMVHEGVTWFSQLEGREAQPANVVVLQMPPIDLVVWATASLAAAMLAAMAAGRGAPPFLVGSLAVADLLWCLAGLVVKQAVVVDRTGQAAGNWNLLLSAAGVALVLLPLLVIPRRARVWVCLTVAAVGTSVLFADLVYERFFGDILSAAVLGAAGQADEIRASAASLVTIEDAWFWVDLLAGAVLMAAVAKLPVGAGRRETRATAVGLVGMIVAGGWAAVAVGRSSTAPFDQVFRSIYVAREVGVFNFHALDIGRTVARAAGRRQLSEEELLGLVKWFDDLSPQRAGTGPWFGAATGSNVVMIQAESLQDFIIDLEVEGQEVTPFLNRWAALALRFTNVTDQTAQGRSSDSELATQVSLLPPPVGSAAFLYPNNRFTGLASVLADRGYDTVSAVAFDGSFWNRRSTHPGFGYSLNLFADRFEPGEAVGWGLNDRDFFAQAIDLLASRPQPFCAYLLTLSLHHPFEGFPDHLKELELAELEGTPLGNYLHTMRYFDRAFADLVAGLENRGLDDSTVVVLWGDHDAGLEWTPQLAAMTGRTHDPAGWYLSQRVPLLVRLPGHSASGVDFEVPAGHQDVAPTVAALLGVDPAPLAWMGRNLLGRPGDQPVVGEYQCWQNRERLFLQGDGTLEGGSCRALPGLEQLPVQACAEGFDNARRQVEVTRLVLEHDLQQEMTRTLGVERSKIED